MCSVGVSHPSSGLNTFWALPRTVPNTEQIALVLSPHQIDVRAIVAILNEYLLKHPVLLPRVSMYPIMRVRWTRSGPLLTLKVEEKRTLFRLISPHEWQSLLHVTGALSTYIQRWKFHQQTPIYTPLAPCSDSKQ